ncbi:MAG: helix-turn-helix domain-containing protein [bacterium]|nr:helix-turn-helix domain-containing protein [bacterium]
MPSTKPLEGVGLSERQARVYLGTLELGRGTVQEIAVKCGEKRVTTHVILIELESKGLVRFIKSGKHRIVETTPPESLLALIRDQERLLRVREETLRKTLPELSMVYNLAHASPTVKFYEGPEGIRALREEALRASSKVKRVVGFVSIDKLFAAFGKGEQEFSLERVQRGIRSRVIYTTKSGPRPDATSPKLLREARFVPPEKFPFQSDISIYGDKVSFVALTGNLNGVMITSKSIADTMLAIFELAWIQAEKTDRAARGE